MIIVSDTTALGTLFLIGKLDWLHQLFDRVRILRLYMMNCKSSYGQDTTCVLSNRLMSGQILPGRAVHLR